MEVDRVSIGRLHGLLVRKYNSPAWREQLGEPDKLFSLPGAGIIKDSPTTRAAILTVALDGASHTLHVKRLNMRGPWFVLKYLFQRSRAVRLFLRHKALLQRGVPTVQPVAALARRAGPVLLHSFLVTEHLDARTLYQVWEKDLLPAGNPPEERRKIMADAASLIARMHAAGVYHRDLKASNILVTPGSEMVISDLDGAQIKSSVTYAQRVRDLARYLSSLVPLANVADRLVFLKTYIAALKAPDDLKRMGREIALKEMAILTSKRAKGKYDPGDYRHIDAYIKRQRRWLAR